MAFTLKSRGDGDLKRRYRPQRLEEVAPTASIPRLQQVVKDFKSRVYLLVGPTGTGKTSVARILARASVCISDADRPCLSCAACKDMESTTDFIELNIADLRKIDDIREVIDGMRYVPSRLRHRIIILDEIHQLTTASQQALLKALEEPPESLLVFLCTTETGGLKKSFIDRADSISFGLLSDTDANQIINQIAKANALSISRDVSDQLIECAGGSIRALLNNLQSHIDGGFDPIKAVEDQDGNDVRDLAQALLSNHWPGTAVVLKRNTVKGNPEGTRIGVENYIRNVILGSASLDPKAVNALACIVATLSVEPQASQYNRLVYKCARACQNKG